MLNVSEVFMGVCSADGGMQSCVSWRMCSDRVDLLGSVSSTVPPRRRSASHRFIAWNSGLSLVDDNM